MSESPRTAYVVIDGTADSVKLDAAELDAAEAKRMAQHACAQAVSARRHAENALVFAIVAIVAACAAYKAMQGIREMLDDLHGGRAA